VVSCWLVCGGVVGWSEKLDGKVSSGQCPAVVDGVVGWFGGHLNVARSNSRAP
jgi:hypothetical protein